MNSFPNSAWETAIYSRGQQVNRWPFSEVVSTILKARAKSMASLSSALEIGCGTGNNLRFLADAGFQAAGIDIAPTAIAFAKKQLCEDGHGDVDLRVGELTALPWPDQSFDIVVDRGALTCIPLHSLDKALSEVHRVLREGGMLFSFDLFGLTNSDLRYGQRNDMGCYTHFTQGRFAGDPPVSCFDVAMIRRYWGIFQLERITRHVTTLEESCFLEERFAIVARKTTSVGVIP